MYWDLFPTYWQLVFFCFIFWYIMRIFAPNHLFYNNMYIDHHRWQLLGSIINKSGITINVSEKLIIIDCKSWLHSDIYGDQWKNRWLGGKILIIYQNIKMNEILAASRLGIDPFDIKLNEKDVWHLVMWNFGTRNMTVHPIWLRCRQWL